MASGTPDFFQTVRQNFGAAKYEVDLKVAVANDEISLFTVNGKGVIYGGLVHVDYASTQKTALLLLYVDGDLIGFMSFAELVKLNAVASNQYPFYIIQYDDVNFIYCVAFSDGTTFDSSVEMRYRERDGGTPNVIFEMNYALL